MTQISFQECLTRLHNGGVKIKNYDLANKVSIAHATQRCESGQALDVQFDSCSVNAEASYYSRARLSDAALSDARTFTADQAQVRRMAAVVGRCDAELTEGDRALRSSIGKLIANGASFDIQRQTYCEVKIGRRFLPGESTEHSHVKQTIKVDRIDDDAGIALLLNQLTTAPEQREGRTVVMVSGSGHHPIESGDQLNAVAQNLQG